MRIVTWCLYIGCSPGPHLPLLNSHLHITNFNNALCRVAPGVEKAVSTAGNAKEDVMKRNQFVDDVAKLEMIVSFRSQPQLLISSLWWRLLTII